MARPRKFEIEQAVDAAIAVFRQYGFEGTSAQMLTDAMGIGRQSLYAAFGDKWRLYLAAVRRYAETERRAHLEALRSYLRAADGVAAMLNRVVEDAVRPCLGVSSICEFGRSRSDLADLHDAAARSLLAALIDRLHDGQHEGNVAADLDADVAARFLIASIAGIRIAARSGADRAVLASLAAMAMRSLR
jgi:AcrR family transcriptional regulator